MKELDLEKIELIVYDFDGVLTDNRVLVDQNGTEAVFCHRGDGLAISLIKKMDKPQVIISTETNAVVKVRANKLAIDVIHGVEDKLSVLTKYCQERGVDLNDVLYVGNDINDLEVMKAVGYPVAPQDASQTILDIAQVIVPQNGGDGVIRKLYDNLLIKKN